MCTHMHTYAHMQACRHRIEMEMIANDEDKNIIDRRDERRQRGQAAREEMIDQMQEQRMNNIMRNGNDGEHYDNTPEEN